MKESGIGRENGVEAFNACMLFIYKAELTLIHLSC